MSPTESTSMTILRCPCYRQLAQPPARAFVNFSDAGVKFPDELLRAARGAARQREDVERRARPAISDVRVSGGARFDAAVRTQLASDDRHILPAVWTGVTDRRTSKVAPCAERPDDLPRTGIERAEHTFIRTALKKHVSGSGHYRRVVAYFPRHSPSCFACHRIGGLQFSGRLRSRSERIGCAHVFT